LPVALKVGNFVVWFNFAVDPLEQQLFRAHLARTSDNTNPNAKTPRT
jgi:hypothetical protein